MRHFPAFLDLQGRPALLLGTGEALDAKAALLRAAGAELRFAQIFTPQLLDGCAMAVASGAPEAALAALHGACMARLGLNWSSQRHPELTAALRREPRQASSTPVSFGACC